MAAQSPTRRGGEAEGAAITKYGVWMTVRSCIPGQPPSRQLLSGPDGRHLEFETEEQAEAVAAKLRGLPMVEFKTIPLDALEGEMPYLDILSDEAREREA